MASSSTDPVMASSSTDPLMKAAALDPVMVSSSTYDDDVKYTTKMEMCKFYGSPRGCQRPGLCRFAHSPEEIGEVVVDHQRMGRKQEICKYWKRGRCWNSADDCLFAHGGSRQLDIAKYEKKEGMMQWNGEWWCGQTWREGHEEQERVPAPPMVKQHPAAEFVM